MILGTLAVISFNYNYMYIILYCPLLCILEERQSRSKLNPGRVGAEFQKELRISGQLGVDDEDW